MHIIDYIIMNLVKVFCLNNSKIKIDYLLCVMKKKLFKIIFFITYFKVIKVDKKKANRD